MYLCISFKLYNNLLRNSLSFIRCISASHSNFTTTSWGSDGTDKETEAEKSEMFCAPKVIQLGRDWKLNLPTPFRMPRCLSGAHTELSGPQRALKAAGSGNGTSEQGWTSRAVDQCELAAWPNKDARAILGGRREEGGGGGESVIGTPNFPSPLSLPQAYFPWLIPV